MDIVLGIIELVVYAILVAAFCVGGVVLIVACQTYYICIKDEEERQADKDE